MQETSDAPTSHQKAVSLDRLEFIPNRTRVLRVDDHSSGLDNISQPAPAGTSIMKKHVTNLPSVLSCCKVRVVSRINLTTPETDHKIQRAV